MLITNGVSEGIDIVLRSIINPGDEVIVPEPCYVSYSALVTLIGGIVKELDTSQTDFVPLKTDVEKLISKNTKAILLCSPSNPTGATIPENELKKIFKLCKQHDIWILVDEIYAELIYEMNKFSLISLKGAKDNVIYFNGFSKAYAMTGWRIGYVAAHKELISRALKIHQYSALCASVFSQYACVEALRRGKKDINKMKESYLRRRNYIVDTLNEIGLPTLMPKGGFYCFSSIKPTQLSSYDYAIGLLKSEGVAVVPGHVFGKSGGGLY